MIRFEEGHVFSQHGLNTYLRCPRRFYWRYVVEQPWPTVEGEQSSEQQAALTRGRIFHQWMARRFSGITMDALAAECNDPELADWWRSAQNIDIRQYAAGIWRAEVPVVVPIGRFNLYARFDLFSAGRGGAATVVDWKTLARRPSDDVLRNRMQTRVYLYAAAVAAGALGDAAERIWPERTRMIYWFTSAPDQVLEVTYSQDEMSKDGEWFAALAAEIADRDVDAFDKTENTRQCARCVYKPLCDRDDIVPGPDDDQDMWTEEELDLALDAEDGIELDF